MIKGRASAEGTSAYAKRFPNQPGNFRQRLGLSLSSVGIGTYLGKVDEETDRFYAAAITQALGGGLNLIDTAVNYRFQRSERVIGEVLAELIESGRLKREEVVVTTKGGYVTFDRELPPDPRQWFKEHFIDTGIVGPGDLVEGSHCMTPGYLATMLEMSRANLGLETIDIYYVHNPETQLEALGRKQFLTRIRAAFEFLEQAVADGKIGVYGTATWNGYRVARTDPGLLSLEELVEAAREVGGQSHHFRVLQLPFNLAMPEALTVANQLTTAGNSAVLAAAQGAGFTVCASASLLQGRLSRGLPAVVGQALGGFESDAQRSIQFVRSTPGIDCALVGMKTVEHVRDTLGTLKHPPASAEQFSKLFAPEDRP